MNVNKPSLSCVNDRHTIWRVVTLFIWLYCYNCSYSNKVSGSLSNKALVFLNVLAADIKAFVADFSLSSESQSVYQLQRAYTLATTYYINYSWIIMGKRLRGAEQRYYTRRNKIFDHSDSTETIEKHRQMIGCLATKPMPLFGLPIRRLRLDFDVIYRTSASATDNHAAL